MERQFPHLVTPIRPPRGWGASLDKFQEVRHALPMLSLANAFERRRSGNSTTASSASEERRDIEYCAELKIDGVAVELVYADGNSPRAPPGDGVVERTSPELKTIKSIPCL